VRRLARFIATGAYTGYSPYVPGTVGTIPGVILAPVFAALGGRSPVLYIAALLAAIAVAIWSAGEVVAQEGVSDPQIVVVDEVVGYLVSMAFIPVTVGALFAAFVAFRIFDIVKPPPGRRLEDLPRGYGVVADDLWAGILAQAVMRLLLLVHVI
jgi:phosphatidylglycerophosphatase A